MSKALLMVPLALALALPFSAAHAGAYAKGFGSTLTEATDNALKAAETAVRTRGSGCVGPGKDGTPDAVRFVEKKDGVFVVEAHYNHHNGSCGIRKTPADYAKELGIKLRL